jgi:hypothetical protein
MKQVFLAVAFLCLAASAAFAATVVPRFTFTEQLMEMSDGGPGAGSTFINCPIGGVPDLCAAIGFEGILKNIQESPCFPFTVECLPA